MHDEKSHVISPIVILQCVSISVFDHNTCMCLKCAPSCYLEYHRVSSLVYSGLHSQVKEFTPSNHSPFPLQLTSIHSLMLVWHSSPVKPGSQLQIKLSTPSTHWPVPLQYSHKSADSLYQWSQWHSVNNLILENSQCIWWWWQWQVPLNQYKFIHVWVYTCSKLLSYYSWLWSINKVSTNITGLWRSGSPSLISM